MIALELIDFIAKQAKRYRVDALDSIKRNKHLNSLHDETGLSQDEVDTVLADFVNYCGRKQGIDYALHTNDLK